MIVLPGFVGEIEDDCDWGSTVGAAPDTGIHFIPESMTRSWKSLVIYMQEINCLLDSRMEQTICIRH